MAAGWPALAVVLWACATPLLLSAGGGGGARADDDGQQQQQHSWCLKKECKCVAGPSREVLVRCTFSGDKNVVWEQDNNNKSLIKPLVALELNGDGQPKLMLYGRAFADNFGMRSIHISGFAEVTIQRQGLRVRNPVDTNFSININKVRRLYLKTNAIQPIAGVVDVVLEDCERVWLDSEVVSRLRTFVFRRIKNLQLSENTFKKATDGLAIDTVSLENLTAEKLPSNAFITSIDHLSITNCTFGSINRNAFPVTNMVNVTLTNVTVDRVEGEAFQGSSLITNLRIVECKIREMNECAIMSVVQNIHIERSEFGSVHASAVSVANELTLKNNTFGQVKSHGFVLHNMHSVLVDGNTFDRVDADAFYETSTSATGQRRSVLRVLDNVFHRSADEPWPPTVRLQGPANKTEVIGNRFVGRCGCDLWWFVAVTADDDNNGTNAVGGDDNSFADLNHCRPSVVDAACANLSTTNADRDFRIGEFSAVAGCKRDHSAYDLCVKGRTAAEDYDDDEPIWFLGGPWTPAAERAVITTVVLLILCGFGVVCAVSAITWLNARGYFIKLRLLLTSCNRSNRNGGNECGGGRTMTRTVSTHSLSPISVHVYAELKRHKLSESGGSMTGSSCGDGSADLGVRVIVFQDKGTQTVPEELTHEMLQTLRDKLDDPDNHAEAMDMIEHLYDRMRVEENCCGGAGVNWYSAGGGGGLDDMTSTITTKAVTVGPGARRGRDVVSVGTSAPSLDSLLPARVNGPDRRPSKQMPQPPPRVSTEDHRGPPSVGDDYMDPADLLFDGGDDAMADDDTDIYCELADLRTGPTDDYHNRRPPQPPPPVPDKLTSV